MMCISEFRSWWLQYWFFLLPWEKLPPSVMNFSIPHERFIHLLSLLKELNQTFTLHIKNLPPHLWLPKLSSLSATQRQMDLRDLGLACTTEWVKGQPRLLYRGNPISKSKQNKQQKISRASTVLNIIHVPLCVLVESKLLVTNSWSQQMNPKPLMKESILITCHDQKLCFDLPSMNVWMNFKNLSSHTFPQELGARNKQHMAVILCYKVIVLWSFSHLFSPSQRRADAKYGLRGISSRIGFVSRSTLFPYHLPSRDRFAAEPSHEECQYFRKVEKCLLVNML